MIESTASESAYTVTVKDHLMIAHSLQGATFGPAQKLHGATYVVAATFQSHSLDRDNIVIDIGKARDLLTGLLERFRYENLDDLPELQGENTTTEFLCRYFHDRLAEQLEGVFSGRLTIELEESPVASAAYSAPVKRSLPAGADT